MLQEILRNMYVDPDILAELPEEQKEMLFFKIRQEQIRRYYEREEKQDCWKPKASSRSEGKKVKILEDAEGEPWTWVFGEKPEELTVEEKWKRIYDQRVENAIKAVILEDQQQSLRKATGTRHPAENATNELPEERIKQNLLNNQATSFSPRSSPCGSPDVTPVISKRKLHRQSPRSSPNNSPAMRRIEVGGATRKISSGNRVEMINSRTSSSPGSCRHGESPVTKYPNDLGKNSASSGKKVTFGNAKAKFEVIESNERSGGNEQKKGGKISHYDNITLDHNDEDGVMSNDEWLRHLRRFKEADERRSNAARRASLEHQRQSLIAAKRPNRLQKLRSKLSKLGTGSNTEKSSKHMPLPPVPPVPKSASSPSMKRPLTRQKSRPQSRKDVIEWFTDTQLQYVVEETSRRLPSWFHGIISRQEAEELLINEATGYFLIRVSEKIWGYTLSYKDSSRIKHFLIDATEEQCYHIFGNDLNHDSLKELVEYHHEESITYDGEKLQNSIGQMDSKNPDYTELLCVSEK